jgi:glycosyltransferase involved in cell wall biosynthesis
MMFPKISVCIPTYNYARFLPETMESVLNQSFTDFEVIIIDDCSGDDTADIVQSYADRDRRIRFSVNPQNLGMVANWNLCLLRAEGEYIKFVFGDDFLTSRDALEKMVAVLESDCSVTLVACARKLVDTSSIDVRIESRFCNSMTAPGAKIIRRCLVEQKNLIGEPSAVMFRKRDATRGFNGDYRQLVDMEMWFHLLERGQFSYLKEPLCAFRRHPAQQTERNSRSTAPLDDTRLLFEEYLKRPYLNLGRIARSLIRYDYCCQVWKSYRRNQLERDDALMRIGESFTIGKFILFMPVYKILRPALKLAMRFSGLIGGFATD